jgi:hypothetical protein
MDANYISALAGLAGAAIGGMTSFVTTWSTQRAQLRVQSFMAERKKREGLYVEFVKEASRLFADALSHERDEISGLVNLYAVMAHIRMISSSEIVCAAERVIDTIIDAYHGPNRILREMHGFAEEGGLDPLRDFGRLCRMELSASRIGLRP